MEKHRRCDLMPAKCRICNEKNTALIKQFSVEVERSLARLWSGNSALRNDPRSLEGDSK